LSAPRPLARPWRHGFASNLLNARRRRAAEGSDPPTWSVRIVLGPTAALGLTLPGVQTAKSTLLGGLRSAASYGNPGLHSGDRKIHGKDVLGERIQCQQQALLHDLSPSTGGGQRLDDREGGTEGQLVGGVDGSMPPSVTLRVRVPGVRQPARTASVSRRSRVG
jgi:hypothetical protein